MLKDEQDIVRRAKGGETEAFGLLYEHYLPGIYRFVLWRVSRREEAEDITHQVFLKAWENISGYESRGYSFGSWLYRIARNNVIDVYRRPNPEVNIESIAPEVFADFQSQAEAIDSKFRWETLLVGLRQLKELEQDVLLMRFVDGLSHREISEVIGKSEGATKLIQHRAIKNLKVILNDDDRRKNN